MSTIEMIRMTTPAAASTQVELRYDPTWARTPSGPRRAAGTGLAAGMGLAGRGSWATALMTESLVTDGRVAVCSSQ
jgi:hypothetical protein